MLLVRLMVHELGNLRHQVFTVLLIKRVASRPLLCLSLVLHVVFLHILLFHSSWWLSSWLNLGRLHLDRLVTSLLSDFFLHQGLHSSVLILEEDLFLIEVLYFVLLLSPWAEVLGKRLFPATPLGFIVDLLVLLLNLFYHLLLCSLVEVGAQDKVDLLEMVRELCSDVFWTFRLLIISIRQIIGEEATLASLAIWLEEDFSFRVNVVFIKRLILGLLLKIKSLASEICRCKLLWVVTSNNARPWYVLLYLPCLASWTCVVS